MFRRTQLQLKAEPLRNGTLVNSDEETVQSLWDSVRKTFNTNMSALRFAQLSQQDKFKWSSALLNYINRNDDVKVVTNESMRVPNGGIKIAREVVLAANTQDALQLGGAMMMINRAQEHKMLHISQHSYKILREYVDKVRPQQLQRSRSFGDVFAMSMVLGALMAADDDEY